MIERIGAYEALISSVGRVYTCSHVTDQERTDIRFKLPKITSQQCPQGYQYWLSIVVSVLS